MPILKNMVVLCGNNGMGKTNLLEGISLLQSSKGLRKANGSEFAFNHANNRWQIALQLADDSIIGTAINEKKKRFFKHDGAFVNMEHIANSIRFLWVTPLQDTLFIGPPSDRRKFIDKLVTVVEPAHHHHLKQYDSLLKERMKILKHNDDAAWLNIVEQKIAQYGLLIFYKRLELIEALNEYQTLDKTSCHIAMKGSFEQFMKKCGYQEGEYIKALGQQRLIDKLIGSTRLGPHRSDLNITHQGKNKLANQCSTGEQKMLLFAIILSFVKFFLPNHRQNIILLLDDVIGHLDFDHRVLLFSELMEIQTIHSRLQIWITGTQREDFAVLDNYAQFLYVENGQLTNG